MSYCKVTHSASHAGSCYVEMEACVKVEHVHSDHCYTSSRNRKCPYGYTHTHGAGCVSKVGPRCGGS